MLKKVIPIILLLCIGLSVCIMAEDTVNETVPEVSQETHERGSRGRRGMPAMEDMQGRGTPPSMPNGEPSGNFTPPEGGFRSPENSGNFTPPENSGEFTPPQNSGEFTPPQNSGGFTPPQSNESNNAGTTVPKADEGVTEENSQIPESGEKSGQAPNGRSPFGEQMPEGMGGFFGNMQNGQNTAAKQPTGFLGFVKTYSTPITSVVLLGLAYLFVIFYKRKHY